MGIVRNPPIDGFGNNIEPSAGHAAEEAARRMRQTFEVTGDRWFEIAAELLEGSVMARNRLETFADEANAGRVHYSARELKRKIWAAFADFDAAKRS